MNTILFIAAILATWRITYMVQNENAPFAVFAKLRKKLRTGEYAPVQGTEAYRTDRIKPGSFRDLMNCFKCLSFWAALPWAIYLGDNVTEVIMLVLAIGGAAILLQDYAERRGM